MHLSQFRPRFTVRRLMVAVAALALVLAVWAGQQRRKARFERLWRYHDGLTGTRYIKSYDPGTPRFRTAKGRWHYALALKYAEAARYPWLPVAPDPPEPE